MRCVSEIEKSSNASNGFFSVDKNDSAVSPVPIEALLPQIKTAFSNFIRFLPALYVAMPQEYGTVLNELFYETLRCHDGAKLGLIEVLINSMDETQLSEYLDKLMIRETAVLTEQSAFRVNVLQFYKRWMVTVDPSDGPGKEDKDAEEIRIQLKRLEKALSVIRRELPPIDLDSLLSFYCDDEVINTVESILSVACLSGYTFWSQLRKDSYQAFLKELDTINSDRFKKKTSAQDSTLIASNTEVSTLLNLLTLAKPQMPLQQVMLKIIKVLAVKSDKLEERLGSEAYIQSANAHSKLVDSKAYVHELIQKNADLEKRVKDLENKLNWAEARCALMPVLKQENRQLRQSIASYEEKKQHYFP